MSKEIMGDKVVQAFYLKQVLLMAQQSTSPAVYEQFITFYNKLIKNRHLKLEPIKEATND